MGDKYCGLYVTFEKDTHKEYVEILKQLIGSIKGVVNVSEKTSDIDHQYAYYRAKREIQIKLYECLSERIEK